MYVLLTLFFSYAGCSAQWKVRNWGLLCIGTWCTANPNPYLRTLAGWPDL